MPGIGKGSYPDKDGTYPWQITWGREGCLPNLGCLPSMLVLPFSLVEAGSGSAYVSDRSVGPGGIASERAAAGCRPGGGDEVAAVDRAERGELQESQFIWNWSRRKGENQGNLALFLTPARPGVAIRQG